MDVSNRLLEEVLREVRTLPVAVYSALVERAITGVPSAGRELVELLAPVIRGQVLRVLPRGRRTRDVDVVNDMVQEVFLSLFANNASILRAWDPTTQSFPRYVERFARKIARRQQRKAKRQKLLVSDGDFDVDSVPAPGPSPFEIARMRESLRRVEQELNRLMETARPNKKNALRRLVDRIEGIERLDYETLSIELAVPVNTLKTKMFHLRAHLRAKLREDPFD
jgi:RNA polymerase sigma factor (sigma-70 family)